MDETMQPDQQIAEALAICQRIRSAAVQVGPPNRRRPVQGADPNELKKIYSFLLAHGDLEKVRKLLDKLPASPFARRSGATEAYYKNIKTGLGSRFYRLPKDDAIEILGWVCRLL